MLRKIVPIQPSKLTSSPIARCNSSHTPSRTHWQTIDDNLFGLNDDQIALREMSHKFFKKELDHLAHGIDKTDKFPGFRDFMKKSAEMGLIGMNIPEKYGGTGECSQLDVCILGEELARISAGVNLSFGAHTYLCMYQICKNGTEEQKMKYLPELCSTDALGALAMSEPNAGSDVVSMKTEAVKQGDYWVLNGSKQWITNGPVADVYVIYARTGKKHTAFLVDRREYRPEIEGVKNSNYLGEEFGKFTVGKPLDKLGIRGSSTGELFFDNCKVHESQVLGGVGNGLKVLFSGLNIERLTLSCAPVGVMQAACDVAFSYAQERTQFGAPIAENQLIQGKMADMYTKLQCSRSYVYQVARAASEGHFNNKDSAAVCLMASENCTQVCLDAIQILGGNGYINDYPTGRFLRDAKLYEIGGGTQEVRRCLIGREI